MRNTSDRPQRVEVEFATAARPSPDIERKGVCLPLSAAGGTVFTPPYSYTLNPAANDPAPLQEY